jgi:DNA-binding CsgD family transcriptional regulator
MDAAADALSLADIAVAAEGAADYERQALQLIRRRLGFDVGLVVRDDCPGDGSVGVDPAVMRRCAKLWARFAIDATDVVTAAARSGGVAVDLDVLGARRLLAASHYRYMMRPHSGRSTALLVLPWRGRPLAIVSIGRCTTTFRHGELAYLRTLVPTLALCEATLRRPGRTPAANPDLRAAASRLTPREREVLGYLGLGYTNEQIALACGNAPRTVRNQLSRVYSTLGVGSRAEAVAVAFSLGVAP